jgi:RNA ligase (TIGR02306 family)
MRKLATVRGIDAIQPIPDADAIECAVVGGWKVVVKRSEFAVGDLAVYLEIDSWVPHELASFLSKGSEPREYNGVKGERLRTVKLRGQISQGLLLPLTCVQIDSTWDAFEGCDVTGILGIQKWEPPIPAQLDGQVKGNFPGSIPKTDQERIQNLSGKLDDWKSRGYHWEVTEKLDGTSMTVFLERDGRFGVCGRNWDLTETDDNSLWRAARADDLENKLRDLGKTIAIQGELIGEGIQGNAYRVKGQQFWVYDVYDISDTRYWSAMERQRLIGYLGLNHVPLIGAGELDADVPTLLQWAEGKSQLCTTTEREGLVYKCMEDPGISFKAISNKFLLKNG